MFTAYLKYISLLIFSGLILTFCQSQIARNPIATLSIDRLNIQAAQTKPFSLLDDLILPLFPALNTGNF